ncbi:glutamate-1-semialdehyde 2,1-aminomutase [Eubacterium ruminantium]|uniref:Glutamate-1-semialdehyde 2,1-aminomutase n=1 Tax=Eubacterium ruminantium TaxID=42322 RepID=A0A1T4LSZ0_9FIRM|nr:glutamate-1-semialdehyde 2,1-aminomutase [Eubacterium ruminantium]SCW39864.1 glutamate-1-semialdehyde 2,1-aminomutase [Eubacterium ruminantium]SDM41022.1 glutamate-1-semialdehyde 2,1-aminomutase [Eubacterium ruminantium]SJZ57823.1 glutamate-1-semialdehyde 2,1-aminomutase [Eubacterium ruminantium]
MTNNEIYGKKAHSLIPAGAHTYSRTDEVFPGNAPRVFEKTKGVYCWDVDGNKYIDYAMACRSVTVGYGFERIADAAIAQIRNGNTASKASKVEVDAAETLVNLIPWIDMVKFAKNGSTVTTAAVKLARAYTGRDYIVRCKEHSFFSYDDWFIGDTVMDCGIPEDGKKFTLQFSYNDIDSVKNIFEQYKGKIACLIMEPVESEEPKDGFLQKVGALCKEYGVVYILDEMITGFRWDLQGACKYYGVEPDLVTYGKGMANGFSVAALGGKREIMELGGLIPGKERVFLISTTHGAEMSGLGAFIETVNVYKDLNVTDHIWNEGKKLCKGIVDIAKEHGLGDYIYYTGAECSPNLVICDKDKNPSLEYRTVFVSEMIKHGILMPYISVAYEHTDVEINETLEAVRKSIKVYENALNGDVKDFIEGNVIKPVFRKFN